VPVPPVRGFVSLPAGLVGIRKAFDGRRHRRPEGGHGGFPENDQTESEANDDIRRIRDPQALRGGYRLIIRTIAALVASGRY
jgi:hypothetical protein